MWNINDGVQGLRTEHNGKIWWERRTVGSVPDEIDCDLVVIDIKDFNFFLKQKILKTCLKNIFQKKQHNALGYDK